MGDCPTYEWDEIGKGSIEFPQTRLRYPTKQRGQEKANVQSSCPRFALSTAERNLYSLKKPLGYYAKLGIWAHNICFSSYPNVLMFIMSWHDQHSGSWFWLKTYMSYTACWARLMRPSHSSGTNSCPKQIQELNVTFWYSVQGVGPGETSTYGVIGTRLCEGRKIHTCKEN